MKRQLILIVFLIGNFSLYGQEEFLNRQKEKLKEKVSSRAENRVDKGVDKTLDQAEDAIFNDNTEKANKKEKTASQNSSTDNDKSSNRPTDNGKLAIYSKFDFIPCDKVLVADDFSTTEIGDFPANWNTNAGGEVVRVDGLETKFIKLVANGVFVMDGLSGLPNNFTLEFDLLVSDDFSEMQDGLKLHFVKKQKQSVTFDPFFNAEPQASFDIHPNVENTFCHVWTFQENEERVIDNTQTIAGLKNGLIHVSIWRQNGRIRMYLNERKVWDLPRALLDKFSYELIFSTYTWSGDLMLGNIRLATGNPDTRVRLEQGSFSTNGIRFESNSAIIKPESYGVLKEIADALKQNPTMRVRIEGHTDADGDENANLLLSEKRAKAVKAVLQSEFGIEASRMETAGKGESEPIDSNSTISGKANNRRVVLVKIS